MAVPVLSDMAGHLIQVSALRAFGVVVEVNFLDPSVFLSEDDVNLGYPLEQLQGDHRLQGGGRQEQRALYD